MKDFLKFIKPYSPTVLHTIEALAVLGIAYGVSQAFPEHTAAAGVVAFTALSALAKGARESEDVPIKDWINDIK
jgi:hypothetical protein